MCVERRAVYSGGFGWSWLGSGNKDRIRSQLSRKAWFRCEFQEKTGTSLQKTQDTVTTVKKNRFRIRLSRYDMISVSGLSTLLNIRKCISDTNNSHSEEKNQICHSCRSKKIALIGSNYRYIPNVRTYFWVNKWYKYNYLCQWIV